MENIEYENKSIRKVTLIGFIVNAILTTFKIIAGIIGRSGAMVADGVHSLSDFMTDIVVLIGIRYTSQPEDEDHNYGHYKYETIATAIISLFLFVVGFEIIKGGIENIIAYSKGIAIASPGIIAFIAAAASIIVKEWMYQYTMIYSRKFKSAVVKANAWHHRSDAFSSIGTLLGIGGAIFLGGKWAILDPIAAVIVSLFIFKVAFEILKPAIAELTEKAIPKEETKKIISIINNYEGCLGYHHLRTRTLGKRSVVEAHIFVDKQMSVDDSHTIATNLEKRIKAELGENMVITIHIEPYDEKRAKKNGIISEDDNTEKDIK